MERLLISRSADAGVELTTPAASLVVQLTWPTPNDIQRQRRVLRQLAETPELRPYGRELVQATAFASVSGVRKALHALAGTGLLVEEGGRARVSDPFLARWLSSL